jgi:hypothetical protein
VLDEDENSDEGSGIFGSEVKNKKNEKNCDVGNADDVAK